MEGLSIEICDERLVGGGSGGGAHVAYTILVRQGGESWVAIRRFAQFSALHAALRASGCATVPPLPIKGPWRLLNLFCLADGRRNALEDFLRRCCSHDELRSNPAFCTFIASTRTTAGAGSCQTDLKRSPAELQVGEASVQASMERLGDVAILAAAQAEAGAARMQLLNTRVDLATIRKTIAECEDMIQRLGSDVTAAREVADKARTECERLREENDSLLTQVEEFKGAVRVYARIRPTTEVEKRSTATHGDGAVRSACVLAGVTPSGLARSVHVWSPCHADVLAGRADAPLSHSTSHEFDRAFGPHDSEDDIFFEISPLAREAVAGGYATILAYGQTGSGKTHTMRHASERMVRELLRRIDEDKSGLELYISAIEVYKEELRDLLSRRGDSELLQLRHGPGNLTRVDGVDLRGPIRNAEDADELMRLAHLRRTTGDNGVHMHSSRSHLVLQLALRRAGGLFGQLSLVDLAGSERQQRTGGIRRAEAIEINRALSSLGDVMSALIMNAEHVPYRNSKLTALLQPGMRRGCRVVMLVTASPAAIDAPETAAALAFASRARAARLGPQTGGLLPTLATTITAVASRPNAMVKDGANEGVLKRSSAASLPRRLDGESQRLVRESGYGVPDENVQPRQVPLLGEPIKSPGCSAAKRDFITPARASKSSTLLQRTTGRHRHQSRLPVLGSMSDPI